MIIAGLPVIMQQKYEQRFFGLLEPIQVHAFDPKEAEEILNRIEAGKLKPQPKYFFEIGDEIRVIDGPFKNFNGTVDEVNPEKGKIRVMVSIFGRSTPVELEFVQVAKL